MRGAQGIMEGFWNCPPPCGGDARERVRIPHSAFSGRSRTASGSERRCANARFGVTDAREREEVLESFEVAAVKYTVAPSFPAVKPREDLRCRSRRRTPALGSKRGGFPGVPGIFGFGFANGGSPSCSVSWSRG